MSKLFYPNGFGKSAPQGSQCEVCGVNNVPLARCDGCGKAFCRPHWARHSHLKEMREAEKNGTIFPDPDAPWNRK